MWPVKQTETSQEVRMVAPGLGRMSDWEITQGSKASIKEEE